MSARAELHTGVFAAADAGLAEGSSQVSHEPHGVAPPLQLTMVPPSTGQLSPKRPLNGLNSMMVQPPLPARSYALRPTSIGGTKPKSSGSSS